MNKIFFLIFALVVNLTAVLGQNAHGPRPRMQEDDQSFWAKRNAYITAEMGLTPEEAATFIPLSEELQKKKFELWKSYKRELRQAAHSKPEDVSEAEYKRLIDENFELKTQEIKLEKDYYKKFEKILSPEKLFKYQRAEVRFAAMLMRGKMANSDKKGTTKNRND